MKRNTAGSWIDFLAEKVRTRLSATYRGLQHDIQTHLIVIPTSSTTRTMPPRINAFSIARAIPYRPRTQTQWGAQPLARSVPSQCRAFSDSKDSTNQPGKSSEKQLPGVSEEAAKTAEIMGEEGPAVDQGTPVEEVG
jgi:hypothetical protein